MMARLRRAIHYCRFLINHYLRIKVGYFLRGVKSKRVDKKFIIVLMEDPPSLAAAEKCIQSIRQHGGGDAEYFAAVDEKRSGAVLKEHGIAWESMTSEWKWVPRSTADEHLRGCFASHFLLWLKCIECNEPIMIFEGDALCARALPSQYRFRHVINLADGKYRRENLSPKVLRFLDQSARHGTFWLNSGCMPGAVAYAITPDGARRLVENAKTQTTFEVDHFIRKPLVEIVEHMPLPVKLNDDFPSYIDRAGLQAGQAQLMEELKAENAELKRLLAEKTHENKARTL